MDELMSRPRSFAEAMVVMTCPVLLALALDKVELNSKLYGQVIPALMLAVAAAALIAGICPLLACCFSRTRFIPDAFYSFLGRQQPAAAAAPAVAATTTATTLLAAPFASCCLLVLACWFAQLVVDRWIAIAVCSAVAVCVVARAACYYHFENGYHHLQPDPRRRNFHEMLNQSHEFLCGVTGIFFLGLETLALQGHEEVLSKAGVGGRRQVVAAAAAQGLGAPMGVLSVIVCSLGVLLMLLAMIPPVWIDTDDEIAVFTFLLDSAMAAAALTVLVAVVHELMGTVAFFLLGPVLAFFVYHVYRLMIDDRAPAPAAGGDMKLASLELTRVTFTGFLAVSVMALSTGSKVVVTNMFLLFAAGAIVFGLSWRMLSQIQARTLGAAADLTSSANLTSFFTHLCIVVATLLFAAMAGIGTAGNKNRNDTGSGPAPNDRSHAVLLTSAQMFTPANVVAGFTSVILLFF